MRLDTLNKFVQANPNIWKKKSSWLGRTEFVRETKNGTKIIKYDGEKITDILYFKKNAPVAMSYERNDNIDYVTVFEGPTFISAHSKKFSFDSLPALKAIIALANRFDKTSSRSMLI